VARWSVDLLRQHTDGWDARVPDLEWTVHQAVVHLTEACLWYAIDFSAGGRDLPMQHLIEVGTAPADVLATLEVYASMLAVLVDSAPSGQRGFHPMGLADASGFSAMACDEVMIHTDDAARGLGLSCPPPEDLADVTVRRLFPWAPTDGPAWDRLRWANGRIELPDHPRLARWRWHCAPLHDWDGTTA
jgi:hypothetical protein